MQLYRTETNLKRAWRALKMGAWLSPQQHRYFARLKHGEPKGQCMVTKVF